MGNLKTHIIAGRRTHVRCGRTIASLPRPCGDGCTSAACAGVIEPDEQMTVSARSATAAPDGMCIPCWRDFAARLAAAPERPGAGAPPDGMPAAPTSDTRPCPWPACPKRTRPRYLMCREHWYSLPADIRARISETYRPGQTALTASPAYRAALRDALDYARQTSRKTTPDD